MTVSADTNKVTYDCNGVLTDFAFDFKIFDESDLVVIIKKTSTDDETVLTITSLYTVTGENGEFESGGYISTVKEQDGTISSYAYAEGYTITVMNSLAYAQETSLAYGGGNPSKTYELMADKLTKMIQVLSEKIGRAPLLKRTSALSDIEMDDPTSDYYLTYNGTNYAWTSAIATGTATVTAFAKTVLSAISAAATLTVLGVSTFIQTLLNDTTAGAARTTLLSLLHSVLAKTADYTMTAADCGKLIKVDATAANVTLTLLASATMGNGYAFGVEKTDSSAHYITIDPAGDELINGAASYILYKQGDSALVVCDGTGLRVVSTANTNMTSKRLFVGAGNGSLTPMAAMTDGQLVIGKTDNTPALATLTDGAGITITEGAGTITIAHTAHTGDVTGTTALAIGASKVTQAKLKTSQGAVSTDGVANLTLPGGEYGFYPQAKGNFSDATFAVGNIGATYRTNIRLSAASGTVYAQQRYVTSSGEVFWIFILRDKITKDIISMYQAPDPPCFGNGGKPSLVSHPFGSYDPETQEIIVINPSDEEVEIMKKSCERGEDEPDKDLLEVIMEEYEIDEESKPVWPTKAVTVGLPKDYETKEMGEKIVPIKKVIPKPDNVIIKSLKKRGEK